MSIETYKLGQTIPLSWDNLTFPGFVEGVVGAHKYVFAIGAQGSKAAPVWQGDTVGGEVTVNLVSGVVTVSASVPSADTGEVNFEPKRLYRGELWVEPSGGGRYPLDDFEFQFVKPHADFS